MDLGTLSLEQCALHHHRFHQINSITQSNLLLIYSIFELIMNQ